MIICDSKYFNVMIICASLVDSNHKINKTCHISQAAAVFSS